MTFDRVIIFGIVRNMLSWLRKSIGFARSGILYLASYYKVKSNFMDDKKEQFLLQILVEEIKYHIESAKKAYDDYLAAEDKFRHIHSFLTHCVLICNLMFPIHKKSKIANKRKTYRKNLLKKYIKGGGQLDSLRAIRNRFEHFDEDLDEWIATTEHTLYVSRNTFTDTTLSKAIKIGDIPEQELEEKIKPFFNIENGVLKYWGKGYDVKKAYDTLVKLEEELNNINLRKKIEK
jgi:hypothetical protein